jgi:hypothetical protein
MTITHAYQQFANQSDSAEFHRLNEINHFTAKVATASFTRKSMKEKLALKKVKKEYKKQHAPLPQMRGHEKVRV